MYGIVQRKSFLDTTITLHVWLNFTRSTTSWSVTLGSSARAYMYIQLPVSGFGLSPTSHFVTVRSTIVI